MGLKNKLRPSVSKKLTDAKHLNEIPIFRNGHGTTENWKRSIYKAVYYHLAYLTFIQSTQFEMPDWMKHELESRLLGEISITSDIQMTPP